MKLLLKCSPLSCRLGFLSYVASSVLRFQKVARMLNSLTVQMWQQSLVHSAWRNPQTPSSIFILNSGSTVEKTSTSLHWNQENGMIIVWESACYNKLCIVDPQVGVHKTFEPQQHALGLRSYSFKCRHMQGGFYDEKVRSFDLLTRTDTQLFQLDETIRKNVASSKDINIYVEQKQVENNNTSTKFVLENVPFKLPRSNRNSEVQNIANKYSHKTAEPPKHGISVVLPNQNNSKLCILSDTQASCLFIYSLVTLEVETVLVMLDDVKSVAWNPQNDFCVFSTGNKRLQIQSTDEASVCDIPEFKNPLFAHKLKWNDDGDCLALSDHLNGAIVQPQFDQFDNEE